MTALELYEKDERERAQGQPALNRRAYFAQLRDALAQELSDDGYSPLLEKICINDRNEEDVILYVLDYAALMECHHRFVGGHPLRDASVHIPHLFRNGAPVTWEDLDNAAKTRMVISQERRNRLHELRTVASSLHHARMDSFDIGDTAPRQAVEQAEGVALLLNARCTKLEEENRTLRERVQALERGLVDDAVQAQIHARFEQEKQDILAEYARQRAAAKEEFRAQYALELADLRDAQGHQTAALLTEEADYRDVRREMAEGLENLWQQLSGTVTRWQQGLDRSEYRMLALSFCKLHTLLTVTLDTVVVAAECASTPAPVLVGVRELQRQAAERLRQMEQALFRLGMRVIRPQAGEPFDAALHNDTAVADASSSGGEIASLARPGVILIATGEALVPADVTLKKP